MPTIPIDNIYFHPIENVEKWKFLYQRRLALEGELGKDAFECKDVMNLIKNVGLIKSMAGFWNYYEMLVKKFIVNVTKDCDNKRSKEYKKSMLEESVWIFLLKLSIGSYRLFARSHIPEIVVTSGKEASSSTSRKGIIVELKDTCKALDKTIKSYTEKKIILESLIKALSKEDATVNLDEDENKDEGNVSKESDQ